MSGSSGAARLAIAAAVLVALASGQTYEVVYPHKLSVRTPGGNVPAWRKYSLTCDATNWLVNGTAAPAGEGRVAAKAAATSQGVNIFQLAAGGIIEGMEIRRSAACTGATTAVISSVGDACGASWYDGTAYNLHTAPTNTDMRHLAVMKRCTIVAAYVYATITTTGGNVADLAGCQLDFWVKTSVLPQ